METALQEVRPNLTVKELVADKNLILSTIKEVMEKDMDFGVIPGCAKPSLWKPGAEKLAMMFRLAGKPTEVVDLGNSDEVRYRVVMEFSHSPTGTVVSYGVGEASTNEEKYKWRKASCMEEFEETTEDRRRKKWVPIYRNKQKVWNKEKNQYEMEQLLQVRTNPADLANTILKMADKRAYISGILKATAASSTFTQDLEDLSKEVAEAVAHAETPPVDAPITKPQPKSLTPEEITERTGKVMKALESLGVTTQSIGEYCRDNQDMDSEEKVLIKLESVAENLVTRKVTVENAFSEPAASPAAARSSVPKNWIPMKSKKDNGTCEDCKKNIAIEADIYWDPSKKRAHHKVC